jgi:ABC-type multidrug transport system fused ATPase/permease subunit
VIQRITWLDRIRSVGRNCRRDPGAAWFAVLLVVMIVVLIFGLTGCGPAGAVRDVVAEQGDELAQTKAELAKAKAGTTSLTKAVSAEHQAAVDAQHQVELDKGKLASDEKALEDATTEEAKAKREAELAPLRTTLRWAEGLSLLGMLAGVGLAVAAYFWSLGFAAKIPLGLAAAFAAVFLTAIGASTALDHLSWILGGFALVAAAAVAWALHHHLSLVGAARKAWDAVPPTADLGKAETLLARLEQRAGGG